jgi:hypothetical protein
MESARPVRAAFATRRALHDSTSKTAGHEAGAARVEPDADARRPGSGARGV